ncbi:MAG: hypothetical protein ACOX3G_07740 [Armatimonadota bacterium]|jgi:hypothetical protein
MLDKSKHSDFKWVFIWAIIIVLLSSLPYIWGYFIAPSGYSFTGLTHNIDDGAVYLSWMRQAADGHFFQRNLFTSEPQPARQFNLLFLAMGWCAAICHLPLIAVFHLFRIVLGIALILCLWQFSKLFLADEASRRIFIPLVGLSAGIGWMFPNASAPTGPVDIWQPEAITFLSIYLNPLFLAGLLLMVGALYWLELARREGKAKYAAYAGFHLLILGNVHTYDVLTVACIWLCLLIYQFISKQSRAELFRTIKLSALTAIIAAPSTAYQFWVYAGDPIYRARANTSISSPPLLSFILGYGLVLVVAIAAVWMMKKAKLINSAVSLPIVWSIVGFAIPYIPIAQQRKLVMGLHIPLCILCAYALSLLITRIPTIISRLTLALIIAITAISNVNFTVNDMTLLTQGRTVTHYPAYLTDHQLAAMRYLHLHAKPDDTIFAGPAFSLFVPACTGDQVYYGHWSETPDYSGKLADWASLSNITLPDDCWIDIVTGAIKKGYYVSEHPSFDIRPALADRFSPCFTSGDVKIYRLSPIGK